mmetsp:Transcript_12365/g.23152  ORF Transcript_12365/g.23152 Transcript_12365/m.23152 type:complete len:211 (+) Transcript_12365:243-875(+)
MHLFIQIDRIAFNQYTLEEVDALLEVATKRTSAPWTQHKNLRIRIHELWSENNTLHCFSQGLFAGHAFRPIEYHVSLLISGTSETACRLARVLCPTRCCCRDEIHKVLVLRLQHAVEIFVDCSVAAHVLAHKHCGVLFKLFLGVPHVPLLLARASAIAVCPSNFDLTIFAADIWESKVVLLCPAIRGVKFCMRSLQARVIEAFTTEGFLN